MFGMGGGEIILILVIALIFLGPEKLPDAAKSISKGIRDLRGATRDISQTIENDEQIGGAIRDIKSALRGDEPRPKPRLPKKPPPSATLGEGEAAGLAAAGAVATGDAATTTTAEPALPATEASARVTLPPTAGERAEPAGDGDGDGDPGEQLAQLVRPATGTVGRAAPARAATDDAATASSAAPDDPAPADVPRG
ncbi:MAG: twin-arginine translocase TatA/TatE family subunit [Kofleriaceae bacterium]